MADPITTEDLYGIPKEGSGEQKGPPAQKPLEYEETPEVMPVETSQPEPPLQPKADQPPVSVPPRKNSFFGTAGLIIVFAALFVVGVWLSGFVRQFIPEGSLSGIMQNKTTATPTPRDVTPTEVPSDLYASWKTYDVISGKTKLPIEGISIRLPPDVLSPICDGIACASQGTYLPGGTRLTLAPRGSGQTLPDFRDSEITDVNGSAFAVKQITVEGRQATEFSGTFSGRTIAGYSFARMRGVMIELSPTFSLEVNHFTPSGITADFEGDDTLFDTILTQMTFTPTTASTASTAAPTKAPTATPSGY